MNKLQFILLLLAAMLASCSSDSFKIDGTLEHLDGNAIRIIFKADSGVVDERVNMDKKGKFMFQGHASQPAVISLLDQRNHPLITVVAANGDHIKLKGDARKPLGIKAKGNKLIEEWQLFRDEHAAFYADENPSRLDAAIEKFVREHPADLLSTVLLVVDYSDYSDRVKLSKLLDGIAIEARPESLTQAIIDNGGRKNARLPRLMSLTLWKHGGDFEEVKLTGHTSLLSLWANPVKDRAALTAKLQAAKEKADGQFQVIDILADSDSLRWHQVIAGEDGPHYWAPGGPMEQGIQLLGIVSLPWYAVADSTGLVVYSGPSLDEAVSKVK